MRSDKKTERNDDTGEEFSPDSLRTWARVLGMICGFALLYMWDKKYDFWPFNLWFDFIR